MTPECLALIKKAETSLKAAKLLADEGLYDFSVSRAYYTMFYVAEAFLLKKGLSFSKHSAVISAFGQHFVKTNKIPTEFHQYLIEGQDYRNIGDYDTGSGLSDTQALEQITHAEKFLKLGSQLLDTIPID